MYRRAIVVGLVGLALLGVALPSRAATFTPPVVRTIDTSVWSPPFPDPMGLGYNPKTNRILVVDSEVEEMSIWANVDYVEMTLAGSVTAKRNLTGWTTEPTDIAFNPANDHYFVSDDVAYRIFEVTVGSDGAFGTSDDTRTSFDAHIFNDPEGIAYGGGSLWVSDGSGARIHRVQPGSNGKFEGAGDDILTSFDVGAFGQNDPEDVAYDEDSGNLFVASRKTTTVIEVTTSGALVNSFLMTNGIMKNGSGIVIAPTSTDATSLSIYIADRGGDNDSNPNENDGKLFEYKLRQAGPGNKPPVITPPGAQENFEGDEVDVQVPATDPEGDEIAYGATGLPAGLDIDPDDGHITGTIAPGASAFSPYSVHVTATDGFSTSSEAFTWKVKDLVPPSPPADFTYTSQTNGVILDWDDGPEPDLAGYNVYRSTSGDPGSFTKLNSSVITTSSYLDGTGTLGTVAYYEISSVDRSDNESSARLPGSAPRSKIGFVAAATKSGSVSSLAIPKPAGVAEGDVLLAGIAVRGNPTITPPAGWTKILEHVTTGSTPLKQAVFTKLAGASEGSTYTFVNSSSVGTAGTILAYRGAALPQILSGGQANASAKPITAPSLTPPTVGVEVGFFGTLTGTTIEPAPGMLEQAEILYSSRVTIEAADDVVDPGALGTRVANAAAAALNIGQVVVLKPNNKTPVVTNPGAQTNLEGDSVELAITATDLEGEAITFGATGLPPGLSIEPATGVISGFVTAGGSANSPYTSTVTANDGTTTGSATFTWTINDLVAPAAPTGFASSSQTNGLSLDWGNSPELDIAGYNIYRSPTGTAGSFTKLNATPLTVSSYFDGAAPPGATSFYEITAVDESANESAALAGSAARARISLVGSASSNGSVTQLAISKPAGTTQNDVLLAVISIRAGAALAAPSGWTKLGEHVTSASTVHRQAIFAKRAGASEASSYTFTVGSSAVKAAGTIAAYRNALWPVGAFAGQANASSASITAPSLTATEAQSVEAGFFGTATNGNITAPASMIEHAESQFTSSSTSSRVVVETSDKVVSPGVLGTRVATAAAAATNVGQVVLLKAAGPQPPAVTNPGAQSNFEGDDVNLPITATDAEGNTITYSATGLPTGLLIDSGTGVISGEISVGAAAASPSSVTVTATDVDGSGNATFTWTVKDPNAPVPSSLDVVVAAASDDAEESPAGAVDLSSSDIELVTDGGTVQTVGVRFAGVGVPAGANITAAWIQFQADEASSEATSLLVRGQAADNAPTFTTASANISSRARTISGVAWSPAAWATVGEAGANQRTPDLSAVLDEIVGRLGWSPGNAMAFIVTGTGRRVAEPFEGGPLDPKLHIEYTTTPTPPPPPPGNEAPVVTNPGPQQNVEGDSVSLAISGTDGDGDTLTYGATGLPAGLAINTGTGVISGTVSATAASSSPYTVNVTASDATDTGSATFTWTISDDSVPTTPSSIDVAMTAAADDAEESSAGAIDLSSSDLELVTDGSPQTVGLRFAGVGVPAGAVITAAWIQFQVDEVSTAAASLSVQGEAADTAAGFTTATFNISSRARTTAAVPWTPAGWPTVGAAGVDQRTPDLKAVVQEIVGLGGWSSGNAMAFIVTGTGKRVAEAFEPAGVPDPTLHIEYTVAGGGTTAQARTAPVAASAEASTLSPSPVWRIPEA